MALAGALRILSEQRPVRSGQQILTSAVRSIDAGYANTAGSTLKNISLDITRRNEKQWVEQDGEGDFRLDNSFSDVCHKLMIPMNYGHLMFYVNSLILGRESSCERY